MMNSAHTMGALARAAEEIMQASGVSDTPDGMERLRALPPEAPQTKLAWRILRLFEEMRSIRREIAGAQRAEGMMTEKEPRFARCEFCGKELDTTADDVAECIAGWIPVDSDDPNEILVSEHKNRWAHVACIEEEEKRQGIPPA
jgi:hypothetical protein